MHPLHPLKPSGARRDEPDRRAVGVAEGLVADVRGEQQP
jgi:hypothetical protein